MGFVLQLFWLVFAGAFKKLWLPAVAVIAVIALIAFLAGGSALWAAGISAGVALVALIVASIAGMNRGW